MRPIYIPRSLKRSSLTSLHSSSFGSHQLLGDWCIPMSPTKPPPCRDMSYHDISEPEDNHHCILTLSKHPSMSCNCKTGSLSFDVEAKHFKDTESVDFRLRKTNFSWMLCGIECLLFLFLFLCPVCFLSPTSLRTKSLSSTWVISVSAVRTGAVNCVLQHLHLHYPRIPQPCHSIPMWNLGTHQTTMIWILSPLIRAADTLDPQPHLLLTQVPNNLVV